jgi:hypothetical protein
VAIVGLALFTIVGGEVVKLLWNWLMPELFGMKPLHFWQAWGLLALSRILFGGLRLGKGAGWSARRRMWDKWEVMNDAERDRFRAKMREKFGLDPEPPRPAGA